MLLSASTTAPLAGPTCTGGRLALTLDRRPARGRSRRDVVSGQRTASYTARARGESARVRCNWGNRGVVVRRTRCRERTMTRRLRPHGSSDITHGAQSHSLERSSWERSSPRIPVVPQGLRIRWCGDIRGLSKQMSRELSHHGRIATAPCENDELHAGTFGGVVTHVDVQSIEHFLPLLGRISPLDLFLDVPSCWMRSRTFHIGDRVDSRAATTVATRQSAVTGTCGDAVAGRCRMHSGRPHVIGCRGHAPAAGA